MEEENTSPDPLTQALTSNTTFSQAVKDLGEAGVRQVLAGHYKEIDDSCKDLQEQLTELKEKVGKTNSDLVQRIEKLLNLMTYHMSCIKQMVELVNSHTDSLTELDKVNVRRDAEYAGLVGRLNRLTLGMSKLAKNNKDILNEIEELKKTNDEHDKFHWKILFCAVTVGSIVVWLISGDHFAKLIWAIQSAMK